MIICISDLHLDKSRPKTAQAFVRYLSSLPDNTHALYILGDLFEAWIGDDDDEPFNHPILQAMNQLSDRGCELFVMHGNRDFLLGTQFARECNATLIEDPYILHYEQKNYLLLHGDTLCTADTEYLGFRAQVRDQAWQHGFLSQSLAQRREIAKALRENSKQSTSNKAEDIMDVTQQAVIDLLARHNLNTMIHGHTHRPAKHEFEIGKQHATRWVLGDWDELGWDLRIDEKGPLLANFTLSETPPEKS